MKKILTLFIALILVAGIVSVAKSADIDITVNSNYATRYPKDRHIVQSSDGTIVVLYQRNTTGGLVAKKSTKTSGGGTWTNLAGGGGYTIVSSTLIDYFSIWIDGNDNIYVAYLKSNDVFFKKLTASPGTWTTWTVGAQKTVDSAEDYAYPTITYQESNGRVWVAYGQDNGSSASLRAKYSTSPFDTWTLTTVDTGGTTDTSYCPALVIRNGNPYIVYGDGVELDLDYATWGGSSWTDGDIYTPGAASPMTDFSVTLIANTVHVAFFRYGTLRHSRSSTGAPPWTTSTISTSGDGEDYASSLTTDWDTSDAELWVYAAIYYDATDWDISYKKWNGASWTSWSSVLGGSSSFIEHYVNTPFVSGSRIPVAWTEADDGDVEFNNSIILDETAPGAPTNVTADPIGWTSTNSFQVNWTNPSDPSGIAGAYYKLDSVPTSNTNGTWKTDKPITGITVSGSGSHPIYIWVRDRAGNINYVNRGNTTLYLDITAPTTPSTPSTPTPTSDTTPTWNWTASGDTHSGLRVTNTYIIYWDTVAGGTANFAYTNTNSYTHTVELGYGTWYAKVRAYDAVDNPSNFSGNGSVLIESPSQTYNWDGGGATGVWADAANWDVGGSYPDDATDKAIINLGSESINTGAARTIGQLELGSSYSGTLTLGGNLTLDDSGPWAADLTISNANATLSLAGYNLTLETGSTFSNSGTLKLQGDETVSKAPTNNSGSTVEYTATSGTRAIKNWTYHHLKINGSGGTFTVGAGETLGGGLTIAAGTFNLNGYDITISSDVSISGSGSLTCSASEQITVGGNWDSSGGTFNYGNSTIDLTGTGNLTTTGGWSSHFRNLKVAAAGKTTTLQSDVAVADTLTLGNGTLTDGASSFLVILNRNSGTPLSLGNATITVARIVYRPSNGTVTVTGGNYGTLDYLELYPSASNATFNLGGDVTVNGAFWLVAQAGQTNVVCNTQNNNITATHLYFGYSSVNGSTTLNLGSSIIDIGTGGVDMASNGGSHTFNLNTSTVTCEGNWQLVDGSGSIDQNWGTSTVAFDNATSTSTLTGSTTFYVLISTTTGKNVKVSSDTVIGVTNHLNFENITLESTSPGATWYLNLSGTQDVSNVNVRDSNASGGDTIVAFGTNTDSGNNTNWDFAPPGAITDLTGLCDSGTGDVTLSWSTPGDDGWNYTLVNGSKYRIDYSSYSIAWSTNTFDVEISTSGVAPYTQVSYTFTSLTGGSTYYFRIWTQDEVFRWSGLSNGATVWVGVVVGTNTYTWTGGGAAGDWDDADNWSGAAGYPDGANDKAVINLASSENINTGAVLTIGELELSGSYSGTLTLGGALTLDDSGPWNGNLTISAGTLNTSGSNHRINIDGNWSKTGGIFTSQSGTVDFTKSSSTQTLNSGGTGANNDFYNISHSGAGTLQLSTNNLEIDRNFTNSAGTFNASTRTVNFTASGFTITAGTNSFYNVIFDSGFGDSTISGTLYVAGYLRTDRTNNEIFGNIELNGSGNQTITGPATSGTHGHLSSTNVTINKSGGSAILGSYMRFGSLTINADNTFDVSTNNHTLRIELGNFTNYGTFNARSGTVRFADSTGTLTPGSGTFNNVYFMRSDGKITIVGTLYVQGYLTSAKAGTTSSNTIAGNIQLNGSVNQTITATHANRTGFGEVTMTMDKSGGSAVLGSTVRIYNLTINADNTFNVAGYNLTAPTFTNNGTLRLQGGESVSTPTNNSGSTVEYTATSGSRAIKNWTYQSLKINGADGTFTLGAGETLGENLTVSTGTFDLNGSTLTINGAMTIEAGAISQGSANLTVLDGQATGTAVTVGADGTWSNTSTGNITLGAAVSNAGTITLDGDGADPIIIASSDGATQRNWQGSGSFNITDVNVSFQTCTGGTPAKIYAVSSTNGGNNTNWVFLTSVRYWVGGAGNWSDAANHWSATSGGAPGASKPGASDTAIFDANSGSGTCTINEAVNIKGLLMKNTYSGTITQGANTVTIGADNAVFSGGTFTGGSASITVNGSMTISGTAFTSTSATLKVIYNWTFSSGSFAHNDGAVNFAILGNRTLTSGGVTFYKVYFNNDTTSKRTLTLADNFTVASNLSVNSAGSGGLRVTPSGTRIITLQGNFSIAATGGTCEFPDLGNLTLVLSGSDDQTFTRTGGVFAANVSINKPNGIAKLASNFYFGGNVTITADDTLDVSPDGGTNDYVPTFAGGFNNSAGTFTVRTSTVNFAIRKTCTITTGGITFNDVNFNKSRTSAYTLTIADDFTVSGNITVNNTGTSTFTTTPSGIRIITLQGNFSIAAVSPVNFGNNNLTIALSDSSDQTLTQTGGSFRSRVTINKASGIVSLASNFTMNTAGQDLIITQGILDLAGYNLTVNDSFTNNGTIRLQGGESVSTPTNNSGSTVEYTATSGSRAIKNWTYQSLKINGADGTFTLGTGETLGENLTVSTGTFDLNSLALSINGTTTIEAGAMKTSTNTVTFGNGTGDDSVNITGGELHIESDDTSSDIVLNLGSGSWSNTGGTIIYDGSTVNTDLLSSLSPYNNLTINSAGSTYTLDGDITVNEDLTINDGTLDTDANNYAISVGGDWNRAGGTFTVNTSTVTFITASSTSTLTGSTTFYGLVSTASGKNVKVSSDTVIDVTGHLNFENITLRSTLDNATWYLNLSGSGTQDVSGVDVRDSNASGGDTIVALNSTDSGNNTNWDFGPPAAITDLAGQCDSDTGDVTLSWSTPGDDGWNKTLVDGSKYRIDYSSYSIAWSTNTYDVDIPTHSVAPHTEVSHTITGLTGGTTWYFQIWTQDEVPLWSGLSNGATVWVNPILSVSISTNTYDFGDVPMGVSTHTVSVITVTNEGNVNETYSLKISSVTLYDNSPSLWKSTNTTTGHNRFIFYAIFHAVQVSTSNFDSDDYVIDENRASTADCFSDNDGGGNKQTGINVPKGDDRKLWFRLDMPTSTTTGKEEKITVTITAGPE